MGRFQRLLPGSVATQEDFLQEASLSYLCLSEHHSTLGQQTGLLSAWLRPGLGLQLLFCINRLLQLFPISCA